MKREIKFRAFYQEGEMKYNVGIHPFMIFRLSDAELVDKDEYNDQTGDLVVSKNAYTVMQYTGLKDKNGIEIYEGDIINAGLGEIFYNSEKAKFQVKWHDEVFKRVRGSNPNYHNGEDLFMNSTIAWEVIGNIYKNPDLLCKSK